MLSTQSFSVYQFAIPLARALSKHGYDITLGCSSWSYPDAPCRVNEIRAEGWHLETIPLGRKLFAPVDVVAFWKIFRMLRRDRYDVVHTQNSKAGIIGRLAARLAGIPVIIHTAHDFAFRRARNRLFARLLRWIEKKAAGLCDVLLFVSDTERSHAIAHHIAPESKLITVGQGIELGEFRETNASPDVRAKVCRAYGLNPAAPIVGTVARLIPDKGHSCLLRAASLLLQQLPSVQFLIAGGGPEQKALDALAKQLHISKSITFTGFLPQRKDVLDIFAAIDVFALPTKLEGFGVVFAEAMASALPVVACDIAPVNTIVKQGETGILVPEEDAEGFARALNRILVDADLRNTLAAAGRIRAFSLFDLDQALLRTVNLFDRLSAAYEPSGPVAERFLTS